MKGLLKNLQMLVIFMIMWIILNENIGLFTLFTGILVAVFTLNFTNALLKINYAEKFYVSPLKFMLYLGMLIKEIFLSGFDMIKRIIQGDITPTFIEYESDLTDQLALTLLANSVTLPPGGITVSRHENQLTILSASANVGEVRKQIEAFEMKVKRFEKDQKHFEKKLKELVMYNK